ncbi:uncharacterized protein LOC128599282 [Ictalurus furcatus]|uniref:uncharacterized protein LOC128599282 n=1 Tax=Ictalurus furcatus TaxID=66913 RepID=UPI002350736F|nr:uncharacterized protein LOC128599282 [Ictalurus furcatus]
MVQFKTLPVFLCAMGFISETLCSSSLEAEAGDNVTLWCQHGLTKTGFIFWFKHTSDSVPLRLGCKKFRTSAPSENCYFFTESERIVMSVHGKSTSLTITAVTVSDTGLYYCSFSDQMIFSNSTSLQVKGSDSSAVFFMLTAVFGAVIVILLSVLIFIIVKNRKTLRGAEAEDIEEEILKVLRKLGSDYYFYFYFLCHPCVSSLFLQDPDSDSVNYAALQFSKKKTNRTKRHDENMDPHVIYSSVGQSNVCT